MKRDTGRAGPSALELLHAAVTALAAASSLPEAASSFLRQVCPRIRAARGVVWAIDPDETTARCVGSWQQGPAATAAGGVVVQTSWGLDVPAASEVETLGESVPLRSLLAVDGTPSRLLAAHAAGMPGSTTFPLRFAGPAVGVFEVWRPGDPLDMELRRAIETAAVCLAYWIREGARPAPV